VCKGSDGFRVGIPDLCCHIVGCGRSWPLVAARTRISAPLPTLTPPALGHVNPYGTFRLDVAARLPLDPPTPGTDSGQLLFQGV